MKLKKSSLHIRKVEFLGNIISEQGIEMSINNIEEVKNWAVPRKVKDVQEFLGFANFYQWFIQGFAQVVVPLTSLTHKDEPWSWTPRCQKAFDTLKQRFTSAPILAHFDSSCNQLSKQVQVTMQWEQYIHKLSEVEGYIPMPSSPESSPPLK